MDQAAFLPILDQRVRAMYGADHPYYQTWASYYWTRGERLKHLIHTVVGHLPFAIAGAHVLDHGCGTGSAMVEFARLGARVIGMDMDEDFGLAMAKVRTHDESVLALLKADALRLACSDESIDLCFSFNAIEHMPSYRRVLAELVRVVRPGGAIYIETPNRYWPWEAHTGLLGAGWLPHSVARLYVKTRGRRRWSDTWDVRPLSYPGLRQALVQAGLVIHADFAQLIPYHTSFVAHVLRGAAALSLPIEPFMPTIKLLAIKPHTT
jgi:2-polyprenyl-3-methyl-5-hydroxy-6-metoxy-1,4-benzoquinol methylase